MSTLASVPPNDSPGSTDGPALQARFNWPRGLALGADGTLYVADTKNETIRAISPQGIVRTLAGQAGRPGFAQGSGPQARFNRPVGVVVDAAGTLYVVDQGNQAVRKITPDGTVSTVVGYPTSPSSSLQNSASLQLVKPTAIAWGPGGDLYVGDENQGSIYRINPATGAVRTWLNSEQYLAVASQAPRFRGMELVSLVFDPTGTGYVGDGQGVIRKISPQGELRDWVGTAGRGGFEDGTGPDGQLGNPTGLALGPDGTLYVADKRYAVIRRVSPAGQVTTLAGQGDQTGSRNGPVATARFLLPHGLAQAADGTLFIADELGSCIRRISPQGQVSTWAGAPVRLGGDDGPGATAQFQAPEAVAVDAGGTVYVAEGGGMAVRKIAPMGRSAPYTGGRNAQAPRPGLCTCTIPRE